MADTTDFEQAFTEALNAGDAARLVLLAESAPWSGVPVEAANRVLQLVGAYGVSGRTSRFRDVAGAMMARGLVPNLASCALLGLNDRGLAILAERPEAVRERDSDGGTALHHAAERGNLELARAVCERGAELDAVNGFGETPLAKALHAGPWKPAPAMDVADLLRRRGATVDFCTLAALGDEAALAQRLDAGGQDVDERCANGRTALFVAARNNRLDAVRLLLDRGANAKAAATDGQTPALHRLPAHALAGMRCRDRLAVAGARSDSDARIGDRAGGFGSHPRLRAGGRGFAARPWPRERARLCHSRLAAGLAALPD